MIRIRRGDFNYSDDEVDGMIEDVNYFKSYGADGIVFGCLDRGNQIHVGNCRKIVSAWGSEKPITFHRAFDETDKNDLEKNVDIIGGLGFS
jgi:copper homeostasis protein